MATTTRGIYYPTSSNNIAPLESHFSLLAGSVDQAMAKSKSGTTAEFALGTTVGTATTVTVTFPAAFASIPTITGTVQTLISGSAYVVNFFNVTASGATAKVTRVFGTSNDGNLKVNWNAKVE
jgi:hypothetical protein